MNGSMYSAMNKCPLKMIQKIKQNVNWIELNYIHKQINTLVYIKKGENPDYRVQI